MSLASQIKRVRYIDFMIRRKATGCLNDFARKNGLSKRGLLNVLEEMKQMGFPIKFSKQYNSYFYEQDGEMVKCLFIKKETLLSPEELNFYQERNTENLCFSKIRVFEICKDK